MKNLREILMEGPNSERSVTIRDAVHSACVAFKALDGSHLQAMKELLGENLYAKTMNTISIAVIVAIATVGLNKEEAKQVVKEVYEAKELNERTYRA